jgi:hypothetical protein
MSQSCEPAGQCPTDLAGADDTNFHFALDPLAGIRCAMFSGMAGRYTGSYLDRSNGWRAVATLADIGRASLVGPKTRPAIRAEPCRQWAGLRRYELTDRMKVLMQIARGCG